MSLKVMEWVFEHSEAEKSDRLVLLALADNADNERWEAYPSVPVLARKARVSVRTAQYSLRALERDRRVEKAGESRYGTVIYRVLTTSDLDAITDDEVGGADSAPGAIHDKNVSQTAPPPVQEIAPEPSTGTVNGQEKKEKRDRAISDPEMAALFEPSPADAPPTYPRVQQLLDAVSQRRGCPRASPTAIVSAMLAYDGKLTAAELEETAVELGQWAIHGNGKQRQIKSLGGTYRTFLKNNVDSKERARSSVQRRDASVQSEGSEVQGWGTIDYGDE